MSQSSGHSRGGGRGWRGGWHGSNRGWRGQKRGGYQGRGGSYHGWGSSQMSRGSSSGTQRQSQVVQLRLQDMPTPYPGWKLYFPTQVYGENSPVVIRVKTFEKYFNNCKHLYPATGIESRGCFTVNFKELQNDSFLLREMKDFAPDLRQMPETVLSCMGLAMHQVLSRELNQDLQSASDACSAEDILRHDGGSAPSSRAPAYKLARIHCRITNYEPSTPLKKLKANYYGKFVSVKGTVVRVGNIKPLCTQMAFECGTCGTVQALLLPDGKYILPVKCSTAECKCRSFIPKRSHPLTETIDWQTIRIQEIINDDLRESGRIPRTVDCELTNDLVDSCVPGDMVALAGMVKVMNSDEGRGRQKDKCMFLLYVDANSVTNAKGGGDTAGAGVGAAEGAGDDRQRTSGLAVEFTMKELYAIEEIQSQPNLFRLIVGSLCPAIYGHEMVKAGLALGLFGGTQKFTNDSDRIPVRGDPHVLVVGDPGLGKSQMLQAVANVAPRSVYVCGNTTTTSGLTVTLVKEGGGGGDYALEAGALVLADQGCCCIDEFDKMGTQHQALLEAMEQQSISIAKAGIVCSLPARTSILAAANPVGGHYNKAKTVSENLRLGGPLLSRFDLVFILMDKPDEEMDSMLSEHVMALHAGRKRAVTATPSLDTTQTREEAEARQAMENERPLSERLKVARTEVLDPIPVPLLRKYVSYARKYVHPTISAGAAQILQNFYLDLRRKHQTQDSTPITTRQLESLMRLSEARARVKLRDEVTEDHARDVVAIMKYSMLDTYMDDMGFLDFQRSQHGSGMSSRSQAKKFVATLQAVSDKTYNALFTVQEMRDLAKGANIQVKDFEAFVSSLNTQGFLLKKGPRVFQLQTAGY